MKRDTHTDDDDDQQSEERRLNRVSTFRPRDSDARAEKHFSDRIDKAERNRESAYLADVRKKAKNECKTDLHP